MAKGDAAQRKFDRQLAEYVRGLQSKGLSRNEIADRVFQRFGQFVKTVSADEIVMRGIKNRDYVVKLKNPTRQSKGKTALKKTGKALKSAARGLLASGSEILGAGASVLNPVRRRIRNKYVDLVIKGRAKKTKDGWQVGKKTFAQGRGTVNVSSGYYLDRHTGTVYAKRERNTAKKRKRNVQMMGGGGAYPIRASADYDPVRAGESPSRKSRSAQAKKRKETQRKIKAAGGAQSYVSGIKKRKSAKRKAAQSRGLRKAVSSRRATTKSLAGRSLSRTTSTGKKLRRRRNSSITEGYYDHAGFHPIRSASDYDPAIAGETGRASRKTRSKKKLSAKRKAAATARTRSRVRTRKATTSRLAGRAIKRSAGLLKKRRRNTSAESIRKEFAGSVNGSRDLFFPQGTPQGLAKLGKLVSITTEEGTIKPVHGSAWLCADTKEKLHIGATSNTPLFSGPARSFGKVTKVEYESSKPHLGYRGPIIWFHKLGEETGEKPTLHADGKGGLKFKGGRYRLTRRGIEN